MRRFLTFLSLVLSTAWALAQAPQRSIDPTLNRGEGLTMTQRQIEEMRGDGQNKRTAQKDIWVFGVTFSQIDSTVYVSDVQLMKDMIVSNGWFLYNRAELESQLQDWLVEMTGVASPLTTLYFHEKQKRMDNKRARLIKKLKKKGALRFLEPLGRFSFKDQ